MGAAGPKAFVSVAGRPLVVLAIEALAACDAVDLVVPVLPAACLDAPTAWALSARARAKLAPAVAGGAERQDSMQAGLAALPEEVALVAVHDAARVLVRPGDVGRVVAAAERSGAALLAVPVRDTLKRVADGRVVATEPRAALWAAQTPQVFRIALLRKALEEARAACFQGTDDAQLVERLGAVVEIVEGDPGNVKITWPADLAFAAATLREREGEA